jgi:hypothetical protein
MYLGYPPCEFCILAIGSMGRMEMSPYDGLQFLIVYDNESSALMYSKQSIRLYFEKMLKILELKIMALCESGPERIGFSLR